MTSAFRSECAAVLGWLEERDWLGHDPFDGLESRLFLATPLAARPWVRLGWIQLLKRLPYDVRGVVRVPALRNPKALGLGLDALAVLRASATEAERNEMRRIAGRLLGWLAEGQDAATGGWGYPFAWQNRKFYAPANTPNAVCTAFVVHGVRAWGRAEGDAAALEMAGRAQRFFLQGLRRTEGPQGLCFSYTAHDATRIHNVNLLVAACVAELGTEVGDSDGVATALRAAAWSVAHQRPDGSWPYGEAAGQAWVDSYHTGFNLSALRRLEAATGSEGAGEARRRGYAYFVRTFVGPAGEPRHRADSALPYDVHSSAQAILTLLEHADEDPGAPASALRVLDWTMRHLRVASGAYGYQVRRGPDARIVYARWNQAWMLRALAGLAARGAA